MTRGVRAAIVLAAVVAWGPGVPDARAQQRTPSGPTDTQPRSSVLPLLGDLIPPEYRADMPLPFGLTLGGVWMSQVLPLGDVQLSLGGVPIPLGLLGTSSVRTSSNAKGVRADAWLFPFLNVYVMGGKVSGEATEITIESSGPSSVAVLFPLSVSYEGSVYGFGLTPAVGYRGVFATYDLNWSWSTTDVQDTSTRVFNQGPRVGVSFGDRRLQGAIYAGAMHQSLSLRQRGAIALPGGISLAYDVAAQPASAWNLLAGGVLAVSRHLTLDIEHGFGKRSHTIVGLGGRF